MRIKSIIIGIIYIVLVNSITFSQEVKEVNFYAGEIVTVRFTISKYAYISAEEEMSEPGFTRLKDLQE